MLLNESSTRSTSTRGPATISKQLDRFLIWFLLICSHFLRQVSGSCKRPGIIPQRLDGWSHLVLESRVQQYETVTVSASYWCQRCDSGTPTYQQRYSQCVCRRKRYVGFNFPYSGLNVTMPLPGHRYGVVRYSWLMVLRRNLLYKPLLTKLARQLAKEEKREVQKVQDRIMLFLLWRQNDGKLGCLKEEYTVTNIFSPLSKSKLDSKSGILIKSQNLPINGSFKLGGGCP